MSGHASRVACTRGRSADPPRDVTKYGRGEGRGAAGGRDSGCGARDGAYDRAAAEEGHEEEADSYDLINICHNRTKHHLQAHITEGGAGAYGGSPSP